MDMVPNKSPSSPPPIPPRSPHRPPASPLSTKITPRVADLVFPEEGGDSDGLDDIFGSLGSDSDPPLTKSHSGLHDSSASLHDSSSSTSLNRPSKAVSKRTHALLELLTSERSYACDLALIRDVYIPLALGKPSSLSVPSLLRSSSETISTASDSSEPSLDPPLSGEDVKIIFRNIVELALFSDLFTERLEESLGDVLSDGSGTDHVGALFLEIIPALEPIYRIYITRYPAAINRLNALTLTPTAALTAYLTETRTIASSLTRAWDLPSLLIKPVQHLMKYSRLLAAIVDETPETHPDKTAMLMAQRRMEDIVRNMNEGRRRSEVVKEVLKGGDAKKGLVAGVKLNLAQTKGQPYSSKLERGNNEEVAAVEQMEKDLKRVEQFIKSLSRDMVEWVKSVRKLTDRLKDWARRFEPVIGLSVEISSEAMDAFHVVVETQLVPLCDDLHTTWMARWLADLAQLLHSMQAPFRLLDAMNALKPAHPTLPTTPYASQRPEPALLSSSLYLTLRAQLLAELPIYMRLLRQGITLSLLKLAEGQSAWWGAMSQKWIELWEALRNEDEAGDEETSVVWQRRWEEVANAVAELWIVRPHELNKARNPWYTVQQRREQASGDLRSITPALFHVKPPPTILSSRQSSATVASMPRVLSTLEVIEESYELVFEEQDTSPNLPEGPSDSRLSNSRRSLSGQSLGSSSVVSDPFRAGPRDSISTAPSYYFYQERASLHYMNAIYSCRTVHPCSPPLNAMYRGYPFLVLQVGDVYDVLSEEGHPKAHRDLPLHVDDAEELLVRDNREDSIGWALASFCVPFD